MNDVLHKIGTQLLLQEPFFGHLLLNINKSFSPNTPSIKLDIGSSFHLLINPDYWETFETPQQRIGAIKHQLLHLIFQHPFLHHSLINTRLHSIALDLIVNQYLSPQQLPPQSITLQTFDNINWQDHGSVKTYYKTLLSIFEHPNSLSNFTLQRLLSKPNLLLEQHQNWFNQKSPAQQEIAKQQIKALIKSGLSKIKKHGGQLAGNLEAILREQYATSATINWKKALRIFTFSNAKTHLKSTIRRPSKRYGTTPGVKINSRPNLLVAIDTSSSMPLKTIETFYLEINQLKKLGCTIQIIEFDTIVQKNYIFKNKPHEKIKGRGGTDLNTPIHFANQLPQLDSLIVFTDGQAKTPHTKSKFPILWVITPNGIEVNHEKWKNLTQRKVKMSF